MVTRSRALVQYVFISPYLCLGRHPTLHFRPCGLDEVFLTLSFRGEFCVGLSQSSFHIPLTRVIDWGIYLQLNLGNEQTQNICLSVNREKFHFVDLKLKKSMNSEAIIAILKPGGEALLQSEDSALKKAKFREVESQASVSSLKPLN